MLISAGALKTEDWKMEEKIWGEIRRWTRSSATAEKQRVSSPHGEGRLGPPAHSLAVPSGYTYAYGQIRKPRRTYINHAVRKAHFKLHQAFKVIQGYPYCAGRNPEWSVV